MAKQELLGEVKKLITIGEGKGLPDHSYQNLVPGAAYVEETVAAAAAGATTTALLAAGVGAMGAGITKAILPAGVGYMG